MTLASYIIRKDGRYFFQKRFSKRLVDTRVYPTHLRIALRTSEFRVARRRMLNVAWVCEEYESNPDIADRARYLIDEFKQFMLQPQISGDDIAVKGRALELLGARLIEEAKLHKHPLAADPEDYFPVWISFINMLQLGERADAQELARLRAEQANTAYRPLPSPTSVSVDEATIASTVRTAEHATSVTELPSFGEQTPQADDRPVMDTEEQLDADMLLSDARAFFLDFEAARLGDESADDSAALVLQFMIDFLGDQPASAVSPAKLMKLEKALTNVPIPRGVPKEHQHSLHARYLYADSHGWAGLTRIGKTRLTNSWHGSLNAFFRWCHRRGIVLPTYEFSLVTKNNPEAKVVDAWKDDEIKTLFSQPLFTGCRSDEHYWTPGNALVQNHLYWAYLLVFSCGLRPSEIGKIDVDDLKLDDGIWFVDLSGKDGKNGAKKLKSKAARRRIPIPPLLIRLGLIERKLELERLGEKRLFPEWTTYVHSTGREMWGHEFSKSWQYIKVKAKLAREGLVVYGGRHTYATRLDEAKVPQRTRERAMGHAPKDVPGNYGASLVTHMEGSNILDALADVLGEVSETLLHAKKRAEQGELKIVNTWTRAAGKPPRRKVNQGRRTSAGKT